MYLADDVGQVRWAILRPAARRGLRTDSLDEPYVPVAVSILHPCAQSISSNGFVYETDSASIWERRSAVSAW